MKAHFVTFYSPGTFVSEQTEKPINSWDVEKATAMAHEINERYGATPYGFRFTTRTRGEADLYSRESAHSPFYHLGGKIMTLEDVRREMPDSGILISNMECNGIEKVVVNDNSWRSVHPLEKGDVVLDFVPKKKEKK